MAEEEQWFPFMVSPSEAKLLRSIRRMDGYDSDEEQDGDERARRLQYTIELSASVADHHLGLYSVDGTKLGSNCAEVGAQIQAKLLSGDWATKVDIQPEDELAAEYEQEPAPKSPVLLSEIDEDIPWDQVRSDVIPSYVQNVTFTVPKEDLTPERRKELEDRFPGVVVQETPSPSSPPVAGDIEGHLQDIARFMIEYPPIGEFEVALDRGNSWTTLPLPQKLRIAHARAIQSGRCGETREASKCCTNCKKNGYSCRTYRRQFVESVASTNHIDLGHGCQNCRILGVACDVPPYHPGPSFQPNSPNLYITTRAQSMDRSSETTIATRDSPRKISLAARMTRGHTVQANGVLSKPDIKNLSAQLELDLGRPDILWGMYKRWEETNKIGPSYHKGGMALQYYYTNLVDLYIIAHAKQMAGFMYAILLHFQVTNFERHSEMPYINMCVIRAFEHLPVQSPLCRWLTILFAFLWNTPYDGDYDQFSRKNQNLDAVALNKFLYGVASIRDDYTNGQDDAVLSRWCTVHDEHIPGSEEEERCMTAERRCKNLIDQLTQSTRIVPSNRNKRQLEASPRLASSKKFKPRDRYGSHPNVEAQFKDTEDEDSATESGSEINIGRHSLRSAKSKETLPTAPTQPNKPTKQAADTTSTSSSRHTGPVQRVVQDENEKSKASPYHTRRSSRIITPTVLDNDHPNPPKNIDFDPWEYLGHGHESQPNSPPKRQTPETPRRNGAAAASEQPTPGRRSSRAKTLPEGFFSLRPAKKDYRNTMWGGFKLD